MKGWIVWQNSEMDQLRRENQKLRIDKTQAESDLQVRIPPLLHPPLPFLPSVCQRGGIGAARQTGGL